MFATIGLILALLAGLVIIFYFVLKKSEKTKRPDLAYKERISLEEGLDSEIKKEEEKILVETAKEREKMKDYKGALNDYQQAVLHTDSDYAAVVGKGTMKTKLGDFKGAVADFTEAIELNPKEVAAYYSRALSYSELKEYHKAISDYTAAVSMGIKEQMAYYQRALAKIETRDFTGAIDDLRIYLITYPKNAEAYMNKGYAEFMNKQFNEALADLNKCIQLNPSHEIAYFHRAMLKRELHNLEGCCADLRTSLDKGYLQAYHFIKEICGGAENIVKKK